MPDTLTGLARETLAAASLPRPAATRAEARASEEAIYSLARRIEAFADATPNLDPDTHRNLLVTLARTLYPGGPRTLDEARDALRLVDVEQAPVHCAHPGCGRTIYSAVPSIGTTLDGVEVSSPTVWLHDPIDSPADGHVATPTAPETPTSARPVRRT